MRTSVKIRMQLSNSVRLNIGPHGDDKIVGRIAGIINHRFIEKWGREWGRFGWIDFIDDTDVSASLVKLLRNGQLRRG